MKRAVPLMFLALLLVPMAAGASELARFQSAVAAAYEHYRGALFYLRTGNPAVAGFELADALAAWEGEVMPFAQVPPDAFADDAGFAASLTAVGERLAAGEAATAAGDLEAARAALEPVRASLAALRARSGITAFSDLVDEANAAMDRLWAYRHAPPDWEDPAAVAGLAEAVAVTGYLYRRCGDRAPEAIAASDSFHRIIDGSIESLDKLPAAIRAGDEEAVINFLRELRSFDRMLWLEFG